MSPPPYLPDPAPRRGQAGIGLIACIAYAIIFPVYLVILLGLVAFWILFLSAMSADNGPNWITTGILLGGGAAAAAIIALLIWHGVNIVRARRSRADPSRARRLLVRTAWVGLPLMALPLASTTALRAVRHRQALAAQQLLHENGERLNDVIARGDNAAIGEILRVDVNAVTITAGVKRLPVLTAVASHNTDALYLLARRGARLELPHGQGLAQPLIAAVSGSDLSAVETLLRLHADPNVQDDAGNTPLIVASSSQTLPHRLRLIQVLLQQHANPHLRNAAGKDAFDLAVTPRVRDWLTGAPIGHRAATTDLEPQSP